MRVASNAPARKLIFESIRKAMKAEGFSKSRSGQRYLREEAPGVFICAGVDSVTRSGMMSVSAGGGYRVPILEEFLVRSAPDQAGGAENAQTTWRNLAQIRDGRGWWSLEIADEVSPERGASILSGVLLEEVVPYLTERPGVDGVLHMLRRFPGAAGVQTSRLAALLALIGDFAEATRVIQDNEDGPNRIYPGVIEAIGSLERDGEILLPQS